MSGRWPGCWCGRWRSAGGADTDRSVLGGVAHADLADEQGNVDRGRAGGGAGRVEAEVAAVALDHRLMHAERRMNVGEAPRVIGRAEPSRRNARHGGCPVASRHARAPRNANWRTRTVAPCLCRRMPDL